MTIVCGPAGVFRLEYVDMSLDSGTKLGPYEIVDAVGAGGMGEVYRANDTRLGRTVAIKVLPTHLTDRPEIKLRFEREARTISNLSHPNICTLHDIGSDNGIQPPATHLSVSI